MSIGVSKYIYINDMFNEHETFVEVKMNVAQFNKIRELLKRDCGVMAEEYTFSDGSKRWQCPICQTLVGNFSGEVDNFCRECGHRINTEETTVKSGK